MSSGIPRIDSNAYREKATHMMTMSELMARGVGASGMRPIYLDNAIEDSVRDSPTFNIIGDDIIPTGSTQIERNPDVPVKVNTNEDCNHGCGQKGTVHPQTKDMKLWQCDNCGTQYSM